jgi:hypothetical protein
MARGTGTGCMTQAGTRSGASPVGSLTTPAWIAAVESWPTRPVYEAGWALGNAQATPAEITAYRDQLTALLREQLSGCQVRVRLPRRKLPLFLRQGFKTVHRLPANRRGRGGSEEKVTTYKQIRAEGETLMFGEGADPIYGYAAESEPAERLSSKPDMLSASYREYGSIVLCLKPEVAERSTWTFMDSLNGLYEGSLYAPGIGGDRPVHAPMPLLAPDWRAVAPWINPLQHKMMQRACGEVQLHGGLGVADVERIIVTTPSYQPFDYARPLATPDDWPQLRATLEASGCDWLLVKGDNPGGAILDRH